jgi:hypothetical protein
MIRDIVLTIENIDKKNILHANIINLFRRTSVDIHCHGAMNRPVDIRIREIDHLGLRIQEVKESIHETTDDIFLIDRCRR